MEHSLGHSVFIKQRYGFADNNFKDEKVKHLPFIENGSIHLLTQSKFNILIFIYHYDSKCLS